MPSSKGHPVFVEPNNRDAMIWRYMDFTKYVAFLESSSLYFARADRLEDPFEGSYSRPNVEMRPTVFKNWGIPDDVADMVARSNKRFRHWTYVNCWHMNEHESAAMWKLYATSGHAVAIKSSFARLCEVLPGQTFVGLVHYIDYQKEWMPEGNMLLPFMCKRLSFKHEQEVRGLIQGHPEGAGEEAWKGPNPESGRLVYVDAKVLILGTYVAPNAPIWLHNLVGSVTQKYGFKWPVHQSSLGEEPMY